MIFWQGFVLFDHRYEQGSFWPNLRESDYHNIGDGPGYGFNVNIPLNEIKMGNSDYMAIFHQVLLPMAYEVASKNFLMITKNNVFSMA